MKKRHFGTDGIRGIAGTPPLDPESMVRLGRAIGSVLGKKNHRPRLLIGKDTRLSGYMIEFSLAAGLTAMGVDVWLCGPIPTPGIAYLTRSMRVDAGVIISASHNPFEDNGVKIFASDGYKIPDDKELELERLMEPGVLDGKIAPAGEIGKALRIDDAIGRYTAFLKSCFSREATLEGMRLGFDAANGAAYVVGPQTLFELGAEVVTRGTSPSGRNINAGFGSLYPEVMSELVREQNLNLGISVDGDADRVMLIDEQGGIVDGDQILAVCAVDLQARGLLKSNEIVATVMSNLGLERFLGNHGIRVRRAGVGDRYVLEEMLRYKVPLGGEQSGHIIFSQHATSGDGILTALMVLEIMARNGKPLSELTKEFVRFPQRIINVAVAQKPALESVPALWSAIQQKERELQDKGRILVRYSGTENKARVMVECEDEDACAKHAEDVAEILERELGSA